MQSMMKQLKIKIITGFIAMACLTSVSSVSAVGFGVYGGYNHSDLSYNDAVNDAVSNLLSVSTLSSPNYVVGAYAYIGLLPDFGIPLLPTLALQTGVSFATKGGKLEAIGDTITTSSTLSSSYIEVPLLLKPRLSLFVIDIYALGGVSLSFAQSSELTEGEGVSSGDFIVTGSIDLLNSTTKLFNSFNLNYVVGGGLAYEFLAIFEAFLEVRYSGGLLDAVPSDITDPDLKMLYGGARHTDVYIIAGIGIKI